MQRTTSADVVAIYRSLLGREPENDLVGVGQSPVEYVLSVALSDERRELAIRQARLNTAAGICLTEADVGLVLSFASDRVIGESIRSKGRFGEQDIQRAERLCLELGKTVRRTTFVDVGANIGTHTLFALKSGYNRAICIEPDHNNFKLLRANQILNDCDSRCLNILAAASQEEGTAPLELSNDNYGDHRIRGSSITIGDTENLRKVVSVRTIPLDRVLKHYGDIGLVWIDTQGHEGHVLSGAAELLLSSTPIVAEFWPYGLHRSGGFDKLQTALHGKSVYDLRSMGPPNPIESESLDAWFNSSTGDASIATDILII